jgi:hypothetical protein
LTLRKDFGFKWLKHRNLELNGITKEKSTHIDFLTHKPIPDIEWNKYNFPKGGDLKTYTREHTHTFIAFIHYN